MPQHSTTIPVASPAAYQAARTAAGWLDRSDKGRIVLSGRDRASFLQGLLTNDVAALKPGEGCYAAYLTPQGRMITDVTVHELGDVMLLSLGRDVKDAILARLDQSIFSEDVQLRDVTNVFAGLAVAGPKAANAAAGVLSGVTVEDLNALGRHGNLRARFGSEAAIVLRVADIGEAGYELLIEGSHIAALKDALALEGVVEVDGQTADVIRIEAGIPRFHRDMDESTIPLEAGLENEAISQSKGCYVGQEVIVRVLHRGHGRIARKLVGLTLEGTEPPFPGSAVQFEGRDIGAITSSALSPALERPIALAYVQRDFVAPETVVHVLGQAASVTTLPFVKR